MKQIHILCFLTILVTTACNRPEVKNTINVDQDFSGFESRFLDQYWKQYPSSSPSGSGSITIGYGKYYENLVIPDTAAFGGHVQFSKDWLDSLNKLDYKGLSDNNKISFNIIKNQLESDIWYQS